MSFERFGLGLMDASTLSQASTFSISRSLSRQRSRRRRDSRFLLPSLPSCPCLTIRLWSSDKPSCRQGLYIVNMNCNMTTRSDAGAEDEDMATLKVHKKVDILNICVREVHLGDVWEVADTHCSAFLPDEGPIMNTLVRFGRVAALLGSFALPPGQQRKCLVAVEDNPSEIRGTPEHLKGDVSYESGRLLYADQLIPLLDKILGILTVDTVAEFLPRRHSGLRRKGIAYISNVGVRECVRRKGIARHLMSEAEALARSWGCRSLALHCDINNPGAVALYLGIGFKIIATPSTSKWPQPKALPGSEFCFMMKRLPSR